MLTGETLMLGAQDDAQASLKLYRCEDGSDLNLRSGVLMVRFENASILLTADLSGEGQNWFLEHYDMAELRADILKAPHHALTIMVKEFLDDIDPALVIFTNSKSNSQAAAAQINAREKELLYVGDGTIALETDGVDWYVTQEEGWH